MTGQTLAPSSCGALRIEQLVKQYRPGQPVLKSISFAVQGTGLTSIIGPSGTGKSTLIRCINRLVDPTSGKIMLQADGQAVDMAQLKGADLRRARRRIGMVFQDSDSHARQARRHGWSPATARNGARWHPAKIGRASCRERV